MKLYNLGYGANLIEHNDKIYMFDVGTKSVCQRYIIPFIKKNYPTVTKIEAVFISHYHFNHIEGLIYLIDEFEIGAVYTNGTYSADQGPAYKDKDPQVKDEVESLINQYNIPYESYKQGDVYNLDGFDMFVMAPLHQYANDFDAYTPDPNGLSGGVMRLEYGDFSCIFGGDIYRPHELLEVLNGNPSNKRKSDVWFTPHHGDYQAMTEDIIDEIAPGLAFLESIGNSRNSVDFLEDRGIDVMWLKYIQPNGITAESDGSYTSLTMNYKEFLKPKGKFFIS